MSYYLSFWWCLPESLKPLSSFSGKYTGGGESWRDFTFYVLRFIRNFWYVHYFITMMMINMTITASTGHIHLPFTLFKIKRCVMATVSATGCANNQPVPHGRSLFCPFRCRKSPNVTSNMDAIHWRSGSKTRMSLTPKKKKKIKIWSSLWDLISPTSKQMAAVLEEL